MNVSFAFLNKRELRVYMTWSKFAVFMLINVSYTFPRFYKIGVASNSACASYAIYLGSCHDQSIFL
jgi:hypothetical protein